MHIQQEKQKLEPNKEGFENTTAPDSFKVAKTILHQGSLMPLAPIVQPVLWPYGDTLHVYPHPDFLVLADECDDYHYTIPVNGHKTTFHDTTTLGNEDDSELKTVTVVNPGNFGADTSFVVIYPLKNEVQLSKVI